MLSFDNTEIAFSDKSDDDLNRSFWLFKIISKTLVVNIGSSLTDIALKIHLPIKGIIKATIFKQFCGGETIEECEATIKKLGASAIGTILDYSVEGKQSEEDFDNNLKEIIRAINESKQNKNIPFSVFKVTGMARFELLEKVSSKAVLSEGERMEFDKIKHRVNTICEAAKNANTPVFIDAEESWIQSAIDEVANTMMVKYNIEKPIVYTTIQMYRTDRLAFLKNTFEIARGNYYVGVKIVRGAYLEKEKARAIEKNYASPIQENKQKTDNDYDSAITYCIENVEQIAFCAATHNENSCLKLAEQMDQKQIAKNHQHIYFAQLLGMSDHISYNLAKAGYNVAKYVPYGPVNEVVPYLIRRAQENTFVKGQTGRELSLIIKEEDRRKKLEERRKLDL